MDIENLLDEKAAAKKLNVSPSTLLRARRAGKLEFYRIGWRVFYDAAQLNDWVERYCGSVHRQRGESPRGSEAAA